MNSSSEKFAVECNVRRLEYRGSAWDYDKSAVGVLYGAEVDTDSKLISAQVALTEHGTHDELIKNLYDQDLIGDDTYSPSTEVNYQNFSGPDDENYRLYMLSWEEAESRNFPVKGLWLPEQRDQAPKVSTYAELGLRALMLTTLKYHNIDDGSTKLWTPEQLQTVPVQNIEQLQTS